MFRSIPQMPEDAVLGMTKEFNNLPHPQKINLGVGIYQTEESLSKVFDAVQIAEGELVEEKLSKDYAPIEGDPTYLKVATQLILGPHAEHPHLFSVQTVGGTSALRLGASLLKRAGFETCWLSDPTWPNHPNIFKAEGFQIASYPYPFFQGLPSVASNAFVVVQTACHNPTGLDPTHEEWSRLFEKRPFLFFDSAYQGFGDGLEADAWPFREAIRRQLPCLIASSFSKNFGLYGERVGLLTVLCSSPEEKGRVLSFVKTLIRTSYSNPPLQGARIVAHILRSPRLRRLWEEELEAMRMRLTHLRQELGVEGGKGLFVLTGFDATKIEALKSSYGLVMLKNGRINLSGLNKNNLSFVKKVFNP